MHKFGKINLSDTVMSYYQRLAKERKKKFDVTVIPYSAWSEGYMVCNICKEKILITDIDQMYIDDSNVLLKHMHDFGQIRQILRNRRFKRVKGFGAGRGI